MKIAVDRGDDIALPHERRTDKLGAVLPGRDDILSVARDASVSMQANDGWDAALAILRNQDDTGHDHIHTVMELKSLQREIAMILGSHHFHQPRIRTWRQLAEAR